MNKPHPEAHAEPNADLYDLQPLTPKNRQAAIDQLCQDWNKVLEKHGSFADEHCNF